MIKKITSSVALFFIAFGSHSQVENYDILFPSTIGLTLTTGDICTSPFTIEEAHQTANGNTWGCTWTSIHPGIPVSVQLEVMFSVNDGFGPYPTTLNGTANNMVSSGGIVNCAAGTLLTWNLDPSTYNPMGSNTFLVNFALSPNNNQLDNLYESDPYIRVIVDYGSGCVAPTISLNDSTNVSCFGASDGSINVDVSGGAPGYTYDWDIDGTGDFDDTEDLSMIPAGTYNLVVNDGVSCSAVFSIDILGPPALDVSVTQTGNNLMANATSVTYQWLVSLDNCTTFSFLAENSASFTPTTNGDYAVIISDGNCEDTSSCYTISGVGINDETISQITIFPNPANDKLTIQLNSNFQSALISVIDLNGKIVLDQSINSVQNGNIVLDLSDVESGTYLVRIVSDDFVETVLIVKE